VKLPSTESSSQVLDSSCKFYNTDRIPDSLTVFQQFFSNEVRKGKKNNAAKTNLKHCPSATFS
jgi:hypothetical protein